MLGELAVTESGPQPPDQVVYGISKTILRHQHQQANRKRGIVDLSLPKLDENVLRAAQGHMEIPQELRSRLSDQTD